MYKGKCLKEFRVTGNLNGPNAKMIMANIIPQIEMRTKVIYLFKTEIHPGAGEIVVCLQVWRRFKDNEEVWSKAYLPAERTTKSRGNYEGKVIFRHVQIKLVVV